jgi:hypothetical protein
MKQKMRRLSRADYLRALALFTMANQNYLRADQYGDELAATLGLKDNYSNNISDAWLNKGADFDVALKADGFLVSGKKP